LFAGADGRLPRRSPSRPTGGAGTDTWAAPSHAATAGVGSALGRALLGPDIVGAIERLNAQPAKDLIKYGTSGLHATLLLARLVDELRLWVMPVAVGTGQRQFDDIDTSSLDLRLSDVRKRANNSVTLTHVPS
jgi:riboflavin biosynthesis pyrimidine reductase